MHDTHSQHPCFMGAGCRSSPFQGLTTLLRSSLGLLLPAMNFPCPMQVGKYEVQAEQILLPPPLESIPYGLPSAQWSSDHISVVVDFCMRELSA